MLVKLLQQHVINDQLRERDEILDVTSVTPYMEGLDAEAREAIYHEKVRVWGRYVSPGVLLDDPPIERTLEENQPVRRIPAAGPR